MPPSDAVHEPPAPRALLPDLNLRSLALVIGVAVLVALLISPVFVTSRLVLVARTVFVALALLLAYALAAHWPERWRPSWLPRGAVQVLAVALAAPLLVLGVYVASAGGDLSAVLKAPPRFSGLMITSAMVLLAGMIVVPLALLRERDAYERNQRLRFELERSRLEKEAVDARLALMQAQIEPHFLFNTLANVQQLVDSGSPRAPAVLQSLIDYLRAAVPQLRDATPTLGHELERVQAYLALMRMRMPDRLRFELRADPSLATRPVPPLALMTLVENAVRHGIDPSEDGGDIEVGARALDDGGIELWVQDNGPGMAAHARQGTGIANLRERLRAVHGARATLRHEEAVPHGLRVTITLPPPGVLTDDR